MTEDVNSLGGTSWLVLTPECYFASHRFRFTFIRRDCEESIFQILFRNNQGTHEADTVLQGKDLELQSESMRVSK